MYSCGCLDDNRTASRYLVDDEPLALERLTRLLAGFEEVTIAGDGHRSGRGVAVSVGRQGKGIDVLFLDIQMPGMTGFELLSRLEEQPFVIFTTAYDEYALRAFDSKFD